MESSGMGDCRPWDPRSGKSGMSFYRTDDHRFIMKQISRFEMQSFLKFAPNYFQYLSTAGTERKLTALAKKFGVFRIGAFLHSLDSMIDSR